MRWLLLAALGYALLVIQTAAFRPGGLAFDIDGHWTQPDLMLLLGLFVALYFPPPQTFLVGWLLGIAWDLVAISGRLGLAALEFSAVLALVSYVRLSIPRTRMRMQFLLALGAVFLVHAVWYVAARLLAGSPLQLFRSTEEAFLDAAYSAILAPYLLWLLQWLRPMLGISTQVKEG